MRFFMSSWRKNLLSWVNGSESPWLPPRWWRGTAAERDVWALRREARQLMWPDRVTRLGRAKILTQALAWPVWAGIKSVRHVREFARTRYAGRSRLAVWWDSYWLQIAYNIRLEDQLDVCLNLPENRREVRGFMVCREQQVLVRRSRRGQQDFTRLGYKQEFARFCEAQGLPAPAVVCEGMGREITRMRDWPARDLIFKPADLSEGLGIMKLTHDPEAGVWRTRDAVCITPETVAEWACRLMGREGAWLVQPFMRNDPSWARFTPGCLATCRVVTGRLLPEGEPFFLGAFARFAFDNDAVDNISAGGLGMGLDLRDGRMMAGTIWSGAGGHYDYHPRTGVRITGEVLPGWAEIAALGLRAHRAAGSWATMGWDIAYTEEGAMLIEANPQWSVLFHVPASQTRLCEVLRAAERYR